MPNPKNIIAVVLTTFCIAIVVLLYARASSVDKMLDTHNYTVLVNSCGCFGCGGSTLKVTNGTATYRFIQSGKDVTKSFSWNTAKQLKLRQFFTEGVKNKEQHGYSTTQTTYSIYAASFSASFTDEDGKYLGFMDSLVSPENVK